MTSSLTPPDSTPATAWMSWSSGKDSTMALDAVRAPGDVVVTGLLVSVNADADRVAMHAVRRSLLEAQADRLGLSLHVVELPSPCPNDVYEQRMAEALAVAAGDGVGAIVFGDLFLADIRAYRERQLAPSGLRPLFPLWGRPTGDLAHEVIRRGVKAWITCVDTAQLDAAFAGRPFDAALLDDLPGGVDPCGERGEFHTFVADGPGFCAPIPVAVGEVVQRDRFAYCDLVPAGDAAG